MRIKVPPKRIRQKFLLNYELKGCQKAVDFLTEYYNVQRKRITLDGRKVGNGDFACYFENKAYFSKRGLKKSTVLHELYHHLAYSNGIEKPDRIEEKEANNFSKDFLKSF
jgi:hypothetical protein